MGLPPGPRSPAAVQTLRMQRDPVGVLDRCRARYGDCFTLALLPAGRLVVLADPDAVRRILTGDAARFRAGDAGARLLPVLGPGSVLLADGDRHVAKRRRLTPAFHGPGLEGWRERIEAVAERELARWPLGERLRLLPRLRRVAFEVVVRLVLGIEDERRIAELWRGFARMLALPAGLALWLPPPRGGAGRFGPWALLARRRARLDELLLEEARGRRSRAPDGVLASAVEAAGSEAELCDELRSLVIVGHETTATGMAWTLELLLRHPAELERLRAELERGDESYLDAVVHESLRLRPPVVDAVRTLAEPTELCGFALPAGTVAMAAPALVHRRADVYPDPDAFRPERFLDRRPDPATWIPFGGGARRCLGAALASLEMRTVVSLLLRRLSLRPARAEPERARLLGTSVVPRRGVEVVAERRA